MKKALTVLMCVAMFAVVGYVSADAGDAPAVKVREMAARQALAASGAAFDLYPDCLNIVEVGSVWTDSGCNAFDAVDGDISASVIKNYLDGEVDTSIPNAVYRIEYTVKNSRDIPAETRMRRIVVIDTRPPVIELLGCDEF